MAERELDLSTLSPQQLDGLKKSLDKDVEALTANFQQLKEAQERYADSAASLAAIPTDGAGREVMVPLTSSLYVPGTLAGTEEVLVDVGTGFYVGKTSEAAIAMLQKKAATVKANTESLMKVIMQKQQNAAVVGSALEERVAAMQAQRGAGGPGMMTGGGGGAPGPVSYASAAAAAAGRG